MEKKTEQQIRRLRATVNALIALKSNPDAAPLLKGMPISFGAVRGQSGTRDHEAFSDEVLSPMLCRLADSFNNLLRAVESKTHTARRITSFKFP